MKKALLVWGSWDGHEPRQYVARFEPFRQEAGFDVYACFEIRKRSGNRLKLVITCCHWLAVWPLC